MYIIKNNNYTSSTGESPFYHKPIIIYTKFII